MSAISKMKSFVTQRPWSTISSSSSSSLSYSAFHLPQSVPLSPFSVASNSVPRNPRSYPSLCVVHDRGLQTNSVSRPVSGEIHVIVGPMFAGKTTSLLRRVQSERTRGRFQVKPVFSKLQLDITLKGLCISGRLKEAVSLLCRGGELVNPSTYSLLLQECIYTKEYRSGRRIHSQMTVLGFVPNEYLMNKLLILYAKSGNLGTVNALFDKLEEKTLVSWNAIIAGYIQKGLEETGLGFYNKMRQSGVTPDQYTFASVFKAYARLATLELGKQAHGVMIKCNIKGNVVVDSALLDMYLKSSSLVDASLVFDKSSTRNVVTWTSMISGYGHQGQVAEVLDLFRRMKSEGLRPNYITFISVLSACSHGGLVEEGWEIFFSMTRDYGIQPRAQHYAAMVDLLCRAWRVREAHEFVLNSPCQNHSAIWGSLLGACKTHGEMDVLELAAKRYAELEPENAGKYIILANAYASVGLWDNVAEVWSMMKRSGVIKEPAYSRIEIQSGVHFFYKHDKSHKQSDEIYHMIKVITLVMKDVGYVSDLSGS